MATVIICRRFPSRICRTAALSTTAENQTRKKWPVQTSQDCVQTPEEIGIKPKAAATLKLLNPLGYRLLCSPLAYNSTERVARGESTRHGEHGPPEKDSSDVIQNPYCVPSSQRTPRIRNAFLNSKTSETSVPNVVQLGRLPVMKEDNQEDDVEAFNTFEDPRVFLKLRPEYQHHSYNKSEAWQALSIEEGELILHKVTVLQSNLQSQTIADYFDKLSSLPAEQRSGLFSSIKFTMLCQLSLKNIELFEASDLIGILKAFVRLGIPCSHPMLATYEREFCRRVWGMKLDELLLVADLWRCLGHSVPCFLKIFFSYLNLHWKDLSLSQLVHLIYIIGEGRQVPQDLMQKLESLVLKFLDLLSVEEVGTVCLGFFKSSSGLSEYVMREIGDKVCVQMQHLSNYALVNILKMFRFTHVDHIDFMKEFGQIAPQRISSMGVQGVMHLTLACSALRFLDERVMNAVAASLPPRVAYCRSKDVAKFLWSFGTLNYEPPNAENFYSSFIGEIHRKMPEFSEFPDHLFTSLLGLAFTERFPLDLLDFALSPEFVRLAQERSKFELTKELYTLDGTVGVECPDYKGNRLNAELQREGAVMLWNLARQDMTSKPEFLEALFLLKTILGGPQYIKHHMILPHTRSSDLEVWLDVNNKPLPFNQEAIPTDVTRTHLKHMGVRLTDDLMTQLLKGKSSTHLQAEAEAGENAGRIEKPVPLGGFLPRGGDPEGASLCSLTGPQAGVSKLAIQVTNRNQYCFGSRHLLGLHNMKRRQLRRLGYTVVELAFWEWFPLFKRTRSEKLSYLHEKVFNSGF
ncbi:FAST kinase domain-containing protein 5, mitochondrial [Phascolarctos cinereus]|uniref:FAST kinase domain-containing protein 5, mitochondrial n=1 Tax=Phascolarctos cinereus TaxID=38626 RepID=A0A6P5LXU5_PHACI|nr:FAST kinase domain-containing protein 5, mitochondrial [Phascolarctos cinereus]XP_020861030.1 FAST kinase domain-containing protein 5, mitochondrial [Phascolarctos cinereus]